MKVRKIYKWKGEAASAERDAVGERRWGKGKHIGSKITCLRWQMELTA